ncbi:MAG: primary-amine oxidase [Dehalococcoidia bacterium]
MAQATLDQTATATPTHPLEPLTPDEIKRAAEVVRSSGQTGERLRFSAIVLQEPEKEAVYGFRPGAPVERRAAIVALDEATGKTWVGSVSLSRGELSAWTEVPEGQASLQREDFFAAIGAVKQDSRWQEAMRKRGITDFDKVQVDPWIPGSFGLEVEKGRRLTRCVSYLREEPTDQGYAKPIEGVLAFVDPIRGEVVEVHDYGMSPIPPEKGNLDPESNAPLRQDLKPISITQPEGPSFTVEGNAVRWQKWNFRVSQHPIEGLVLHNVGYEDGGLVRPILYRAALSEMVVPYGSISPMHFWKNAFDAGEVGLGKCVNSLELGCDCLGEIYYFDSYFVDGAGEPEHRPNSICMHEEDYGVLWKHYDLYTDRSDVRRSRRLVVSSFHTVGNYDYGFFWYFYQDGTMQLEIKLTGFMQTMAVADGAAAGAALVAPNLAAPHHQHLFNFRLDFDIDGMENSVYEVDVEAVAEGDDNPYSNLFEPKLTPLRTEKEAQRVVDPFKSRTWRVVNTQSRNRLGQEVGYRLMPNSTPTLFAGEKSAVRRRAAFATKNLWVTPFSAAEMHAAGDFPNQHPGGAGLGDWTRADRSLDNKDVVLWYTFGITHIARTEDWPIVPVEYTGFMLQPVNFFDRNPAMDVPPPMASNGHCHDE